MLFESSLKSSARSSHEDLEAFLGLAGSFGIKI